MSVIFDDISAPGGGMVGKFVDIAIVNPDTSFVLAHMDWTTLDPQMRPLDCYKIFTDKQYFRLTAYKSKLVQYNCL